MKTKPRVRLKAGSTTGNVVEIKPPSPDKELIKMLESVLEDAKSGELVGLVLIGTDKGGRSWNAFCSHPDHDYQKLNYDLHKATLEHDIWAMLKDSDREGIENSFSTYFVTRREYE